MRNKSNRSRRFETRARRTIRRTIRTRRFGGTFFVGQAGPPTWVLKANLARIHSEPVPASAAMPRARDAYGTQSYFFLEALAFLWRSLISRRAASRAAARTSVFSVRFLVMACCGKETGKGQHAGRVGLYVGGSSVFCLLAVTGTRVCKRGFVNPAGWMKVRLGRGRDVPRGRRRRESACRS